MFKVIKLITGEVVIADLYEREELLMFIRETPEGDQLEKESVYTGEDSLILVNPFCIFTVMKNDKPVVVFDKYIPYTDENMTMISKQSLISISNPSEFLLKHYERFVIQFEEEYYQKQQGFDDRLKNLSKNIMH